MFDKGTNPLAAGDILNALEAALYRGRIGRRRFMQLALATGASLSAVRAMAQEGGDAAITQLYNAQNLADSYDYIVVGSGSGGATVAGRLGETGASVLVLEAGDTDQIEAALNPAESDFIYFVAKTLNPADGHNFAATLDEHNSNVAAYRKLEAARPNQ